MAWIEESVEINRPIERVFAYVGDAKTWPKWHLSMLEAQQTSQGKMGVGTTFGGANKVMGMRMPWTSKVTEHEVNRKWRENITSGSTMIDEHLTFESTGKGTKFTQVYDMKVGGLLKLIAPMVVSSMRKEMKANLGNLRILLEAQP